MILAFSLMLRILCKRSWLDWMILFIGVALSFLTRPHISVSVVFSMLLFYGIYYSGNGNAGKRYLARFAALILLIGVAIGGYYFLLDSVQKYSSAGYSDIADFIESRQDVYAGTASGVDLSDYPVWAKFFIFLLGALPVSIGGLLQIVAFLEGLVIMGMMIYVSAHIKISWFRSWDKRCMGIFFFFIFLTVTILLSLVAGNQGLAVRQRVMAYIPLGASFIFTLWSVSESRVWRKICQMRLN